ncbi:hypothetical protein Droror1_Dr00022771 [Drosera rotundifolia]
MQAEELRGKQRNVEREERTAVTLSPNRTPGEQIAANLYPGGRGLHAILDHSSQSSNAAKGAVHSSAEEDQEEEQEKNSGMNRILQLQLRKSCLIQILLESTERKVYSPWKKGQGAYVWREKKASLSTPAEAHKEPATNLKAVHSGVGSSRATVNMDEPRGEANEGDSQPTIDGSGLQVGEQTNVPVQQNPLNNRPQSVDIHDVGGTVAKQLSTMQAEELRGKQRNVEREERTAVTLSPNRTPGEQIAANLYPGGRGLHAILDHSSQSSNAAKGAVYSSAEEDQEEEQEKNSGTLTGTSQ